MDEVQAECIVPVLDDAEEAAEKIQNTAQQVKGEVRKSDEDQQNERSRMEADFQAKVQEKAEAAFDEVTEQSKEMLDNMEDDLVPPLDMLVPFLQNIMTHCAPRCFRSIWNCFDKLLGKAPALVHLILIEFLPMWFFLFSVRSVLMSNIKHVLTIGEEGDQNDNYMKRWSRDGNRPYWEGLLQKCIDKQTSELFDNMRCIDRHECVERLNYFYYTKSEKRDCGVEDEAMMLILWGAYLVVFIMVLYIVMAFICQGLCCKRLPHGRYLQFCLDIKRRVLYRWLSGLLTTCAAGSLLGLLIMAIQMGIVWWFIQEALLAVLITAMSMRSFTRPYRPKFNTLDVDGISDKFSELQFQRKFFEGSGGFCSRFSSALLQASRLPGAPLLRGMLKLPSKDEQRADDNYVRKVKSICERPQEKHEPSTHCWQRCSGKPSQ